MPDRPAWLDGGRIPGLDGLRAISIALVIFEHALLSSGYLPAGGLGRFLGDCGTIGVDIFFAISGFLITLLLLREYRRTNTVSLKGFYLRRFFRLMPPAAVFLLTIFALQLAGYVSLARSDWLHVLTYTVNFDPDPVWEVGHLWSLSIEEQFYFAWPIGLVLFTPRRLRVVALLWLGGAALVRFILLRLHPHDMDRFALWTPLRVDCIAAGCLLALVAPDPDFRRRTRVGRTRAMAIVAAAVALTFLSAAVGTQVAMYGATVEPSVRAACVAALIWFTINHAQTAWGRLLNSRPLVILGLLSYSLYLWQNLFLTPRRQNWFTTLPVSLLCALAAAGLSYLLVERPFLRLKDRLDMRRRDGRTAAPGGP